MLYGTNSGFLYDKLRYRAKKDTKSVNNEDNLDDNVCPSVQNIFSDEEKDELLHYFKYCVVAQNKEELQSKLEMSIEFRRQILQDPPEPIYKLFAFYFVDPNLVIKDLIFLHLYQH